EIQCERDLARRFVQRMELPAPVQVLERPVAQRHVDALWRREHVLRGEPGAQRAEAQVQPGHHPVGPLLQHPGLLAPREPPWVGRHVVDELEHAGGRMLDECAALDDRHRDFGDNGAMGKKSGKDKANGGGTIALNKRARHEYHIEERFEAGLALQGWELKSIRAGRANITQAYAVVRDGELFLFGAQITPLISASTHVVADDRRTRKLLLHRREIDTLIGRVQRDGFTLVPTALYWKGNKVKAELALARGKQSH